MRSEIRPAADAWWQVEFGSGRAQILAEGPEDAVRKAAALLTDLGVRPGGRAGLHETYLRMCAAATGGRR